MESYTNNTNDEGAKGTQQQFSEVFDLSPEKVKAIYQLGNLCNSSLTSSGFLDYLNNDLDEDEKEEIHSLVADLAEIALQYSETVDFDKKTSLKQEIKKISQKIDSI